MSNTENLQIKSIRQCGPRTLDISWSNGTDLHLDVVELRRKCPCASCIDEWTRQPLLKPDSISEEVRPTKIKSIGRYAIGIHFSDGHSTGIYTYEYLNQQPRS